MRVFQMKYFLSKLWVNIHFILYTPLIVIINQNMASFQNQSNVIKAVEHKDIIKSIIGEPHHHENILILWCRESMISSVGGMDNESSCLKLSFEITFKSLISLFLFLNTNINNGYLFNAILSLYTFFDR